jgi:hypothetical protein
VNNADNAGCVGIRNFKCVRSVHLLFLMLYTQRNNRGETVKLVTEIEVSDAATKDGSLILIGLGDI